MFKYGIFIFCFICPALILVSAATDNDVDWFAYYLDHHLGAEPFSYTGLHAPTFDYSDFLKKPTISTNPDEFRYPGTDTNISKSVYSQNTGFMITSSPTGADVYLNGENKGKTRTLNSLKLFGLESGPYEIVIAYPGYQSYSQTFMLVHNQVVRINAILSPDEKKNK